MPKIASMKTGVMAVMLIDCIAAIPCAAGMRASAGMTNVEKAKKTPPTTPQPIEQAKVRVESTERL